MIKIWITNAIAQNDNLSSKETSPSYLQQGVTCSKGKLPVARRSLQASRWKSYFPLVILIGNILFIYSEPGKLVKGSLPIWHSSNVLDHQKCCMACPGFHFPKCLKRCLIFEQSSSWRKQATRDHWVCWY